MRIYYAIPLIMIILSGCNGEKVQSVGCPYVGGYEAIFAEFDVLGSLGSSGLTEVWEDEAFPLNIHLTNRGEYTIPPQGVKFEIKGISPADFTGLDWTIGNSNEIRKVMPDFPEGGDEYVYFGNGVMSTLQGPYYDANIKVEMTYKYETYVQIPQVCYKYDIRETEVCDVDESKTACASGGPFQVGPVYEKYYGKGRIALEIPIYNSGNGKSAFGDSVMRIDSDDFAESFRPEWDEFSFEVVNNVDGWICDARGDSNKGRITYPGGYRNSNRVTIRCILENLPENALYTRAFTLKLMYYYQDWIQTTIRVKENPI